MGKLKKKEEKRSYNLRRCPDGEYSEAKGNDGTAFGGARLRARSSQWVNE
jgi:hypothetical protein